MGFDHERGKRALGLERSPTKGWVVLGLLAALVALTGGASRFDAIQIIPLRTLSALFFIPALFYISATKARDERTLLVLFACFASLVVIQLLPLPPELWHELPGRSEIFRLDAALGLEDVWRPLTMTPTRTWNVLGSLVVPAAGLLLSVAYSASTLTLLRLIAALGVLNATLSLLQIIAGSASPLYLYALTNRGGAVGVFANENHAAFFAACSMLVVAILGIRVRQLPGRTWESLAYPFAFFLIAIASLTGGSRAGFAASLGAIVISALMLIWSPGARRGHSAARSDTSWLDQHPRLILAFPVIFIGVVAGAFIALDRTPAFRDILASDSFADLRWSIWPVMAEMLGAHWVLGTGFGSFEQVYQIHEPAKLLMPQYVNQAHNDWAQLIIEGGLFAALILTTLLVWMAKAVIALSARRQTRVLAIFWISIFAILGLSSIIDYPLRTPLFQLVSIWLLLGLSRDLRDMKAT
ncbi:O-antigen ligase family protein [Erythrobacter aureus]|uniref:O-antigen ligase domain-containing protein n=1 Tax=Erythrobacter aureus TaxID=2182384 RepID=A0A345YFY3_9SPHN|nr:O-antigen ligase family protein [Erythrobacter aureus]AXK42835.1 O-antigen ligase domain-containing protein [Erythrobacter aureus]